ncbi:MAG: hypothetical protein ACXW3C_04080 [Pyrinomonadaceae bacterium]
MGKSRIKAALALALLFALVVACNMSTANLSSVKLGKDKTASQETSTFGADETVYAVAVVSNAPGKVKVKGALAFEDVEGQKPGPIPGLEKTLDLDGSGTATYTFTPPPSGWPKGKFKVEVTLMDESGAQKDQKSATFSVS